VNIRGSYDASSIVIRVLSKIPRKEVVTYGPVSIDNASKLLSKNRSAKIGPADTVKMLIARLEQNEKDRAELIKNMAERQEILVQSIQVLNARLRISLVLAVLLAMGPIFILPR